MNSPQKKLKKIKTHQQSLPLQEKDVFLWALPRSDRIVIQLSFFLFILVYLFCMLDSTSCITYVEMLRVCNASIEL